MFRMGVVLELYSFDLEIHLFRLVDALVKGPITASVDVPIKAQGDTHGFVAALWDKP